MTPFDQIAESYSTLWSCTDEGHSQREEVWREIDDLFRPGDKILDLGCGTGDDALHLMSHGVHVVGVDTSERMVAVARSRGVEAHCVSMWRTHSCVPRRDFSRRFLRWRTHSGVETSLDAARTSAYATSTTFDGAISNFGAVNCIPALEPLASDLANLLPLGAYFALCIMGRFHWRETLRYFLKLDMRKAVRRWSGRATWRGMEIRYWSVREIRAAFQPHFTLLKRIPIGKGDHQLYILKRGAQC